MQVCIFREVIGLLAIGHWSLAKNGNVYFQEPCSVSVGEREEVKKM